MIETLISLSSSRRFLLWGLLGLSIAAMGCKKPNVVPGPAGMASAISFYRPGTFKREYWPTKRWKLKTPAALGIDPSALKAAEDYAFARKGNDKDRKGPRTDGLVIIKHGYLAYERYARGFKANTPHLAWSVSKSFVNALYGIASRQGKYKLDDPAAKYYKPLQTTKHHKAISIRHLLQMSSGLHWYEGYEAGILNSSVLAMLYGKGRTDMAAFAAGFPMAYLPGTHYYYSSGTTNLAVGVLQAMLKKQKLEPYMWGELFDPIGMKQVTWQRDGAKQVVGSSYLYAPPRQLAKFGYLYLNDGVWDGKRILPKGWVRFSTTTAKADPLGIYGAQWWLNTGRPAKGIPQRFPEAPSDLFMASGHWGQRIIVIPSMDLVVVLTADNRDKAFQLRHFLKLLMKACKTRTLQVKSPTTTPRPSVVPVDKRTTTQTPTTPAIQRQPGGR